ncbi:MAG: DUF4190 domain-containing protein [Lachnospiraceae bacterium]|nr:DUF4190 domain-containing protein [Lachnospiraceae bacterium]
MDGNNMNQVDDYTYAAEGTYETPATEGSNGLAIASLICGIVGLVCCGGGIVSIVAIILGAMGKKKGVKTGMAKWGLGLGIAGVVISVLVVIVYVVLMALGLIAGGMEY